MSFLILGLGRTGRAVARYLLTCGETVLVTDDRLSWDSVPEEFASHPLFRFVPSAELAGCDFAPIKECIASPGFPPHHPLFSLLAEKEIPVVSEIEFAARLVTFPLIGVTGSCGKSTTVALIGHILGRAGFSVFVGGNFGTALIESLENPTAWDWGVVELSSFQLERVTTARFHIAAFLNLFTNHLDYHGTLERYFQAKGRIFENQRKEDVGILNFTNPGWQTRLVKGMKARIVPVAVSKRLREGFYIQGEKIWEVGTQAKEILSLGQCSLPGKHNWENLLVAVAVARTIGISEDLVAEAVGGFRGLPHRLEWVGCVDGVNYFNDSKSTTPAATRVAVEALGGPLILILGGKAKIDDFSELVDVFDSGKIKEVIIYGVSRSLIARFIPPDLPVHLVFSLPEAVAVAKKIAHRGDVVLLSPACTSWDQYRDFEERGAHFRELVVREVS